MRKYAIQKLKGKVSFFERNARKFHDRCIELESQLTRADDYIKDLERMINDLMGSSKEQSTYIEELRKIRQQSEVEIRTQKRKRPGITRIFGELPGIEQDRGN